MSLQFSDLDELLSKVRNTHAKKYFNEAIVAYRSGAYRASVISTWIAICVDVIEKVRELSVSIDIKQSLCRPVSSRYESFSRSGSGYR